MTRFLLISAFQLLILSSVFAQIAPTDSPYYQDGSYQVIADSDASINPTVFTFRPDAQAGETFPVFFFQLGANGIGSSVINENTYDLYLEHLASYGYIVIVVNSATGGFPNGAVYEDIYDWYLDKLSDSNHWMSSLANPASVAIGGHSLGGVQATAFLENHQTEIGGIVYFASYPSQGFLGIGAHNVSGYSGTVLSIAGTEDEDSTPAECLEGYNEFSSASCRYWVLIEGMGHAGFGDYVTGSQLVGSVGRVDATASVRHYLVSFMEHTFKSDATAEANLKTSALRPNTEDEFETNCAAILTGLTSGAETDFSVYPNPFGDVIRLDWKNNDVVNIQISSVDGRVVIRKQIQGNQSLNLEGLAAGAYSLKCFSKTGQMKSLLVLKN